jgi:hypothetical protein
MDGGVRATAGSAAFAQYFDSFSIAGTDQPTEVSLRFEVTGQVMSQLTAITNDAHGGIFSFSTTPNASGQTLDSLEASALRASGGWEFATNHVFLRGQALLARGDGFRVNHSREHGFSELEVDDDNHFRGVFSQTVRRSNVSGLYEFVNTCYVIAESANGVALSDVGISLVAVTDGSVTFLDISPFISVLSSGDFQAEADVDESGNVDFLDISPFINILSGP